MNLGSVIERLKENYHRYGPGAALHDVECLALNHITPFEILKGMSIALGDVTDPALFEAPGFEGRFVDAETLERFARAGTHDMDAAFLDEALAHGDRCYGLFDREQLASYGWYARGPTPIDGHFLLHFDPAYTYMYKGVTLPDYRGKRLHAVGMCRALRTVTDEGQKGLVSYVASNNFASLRSVTRMGYRIFGDLYLLRTWERPLAYATRGCRQFSFWAEVRRGPAELSRR